MDKASVYFHAFPDAIQAWLLFGKFHRNRIQNLLASLSYSNVLSHDGEACWNIVGSVHHTTGTLSASSQCEHVHVPLIADVGRIVSIKD
jgi:hypothetical protein